MNSLPRIFGLAAAAVMLLGSCGQSGPLFLPEETPPATDAAAPGAPGVHTGDQAAGQNDTDDEER